VAMDIREQQKLINQYMPWIHQNVQKVHKISKIIDYEDFVNVGQMAIFEAIDSFEEGKDTVLQTHIMNMIRFRILTKLRNGFHFKPCDYNHMLTIKKYKKIAEAQLRSEGNIREATAEEIYQAILESPRKEKFSIQRISTVLDIINMKFVPTNYKDPDTGMTINQISSDFDMTEAIVGHENSKLMRRAIAKLKVQEQKVIIGRFFDERTLDDLGKELGVTRERIRQIQVIALNKLSKIIPNLRPETKEPRVKIRNRDTSTNKKVQKLIPTEDLMPAIQIDHQEEVECFNPENGIHPFEYSLNCASFKMIQLLKIKHFKNKTKLAKVLCMTLKSVYNQLKYLEGHNIIGKLDDGTLYVNPPKNWTDIEHIPGFDSVKTERKEKSDLMAKKIEDRLRKELKAEMERMFKQFNNHDFVSASPEPLEKLKPPKIKKPKKEKVKVAVSKERFIDNSRVPVISKEIVEKTKPYQDFKEKDKVETAFGYGHIEVDLGYAFEVKLYNGKYVILKSNEMVRL
jgi:RNA polymerase sigma factor (sigma-70 family)